MRLPASLLFCMIALLSATQVFGGDLLVNVQKGPNTGQQDTAPGAVTFYGVNPLRFTTLLKEDTTFTPPPSPPAGLAPAPPPPCPNLGKDTEVFGVENDLNAAAADIDAQLESVNATSRSTLETALTTVVAAMNKPDSKEATAAQDLQCLKSSEAAYTAPDQKADIDALVGVYSAILAPPLRVSQFASDEPVSCNGLHGGSETSTFTLTLTAITPPKLKLANSPALIPPSANATQQSNASLSCLGSIAVSGGFLFSSLSNKTYTAINS